MASVPFTSEWSVPVKRFSSRDKSRARAAGHRLDQDSPLQSDMARRRVIFLGLMSCIDRCSLYIFRNIFSFLHWSLLDHVRVHLACDVTASATAMNDQAMP